MCWEPGLSTANSVGKIGTCYVRHIFIVGYTVAKLCDWIRQLDLSVAYMYQEILIVTQSKGTVHMQGLVVVLLNKAKGVHTYNLP